MTYDIRRICQGYNRYMGYAPVNYDLAPLMTSTFGHLVADAYEALPLRAYTLQTEAAYAALSYGVRRQFQWLEMHGLRFTPTDAHIFDAYPDALAMMADVRDNGHLLVFTGGEPNPLFAATNYQFRAIHDVFGHVAADVDFSVQGEDIAYRVHRQSFTRLSGLALATETRGQNLWVHYGPYAHLPLRNRPYAVQKAALLPMHLIGESGA